MITCPRCGYSPIPPMARHCPRCFAVLNEEGQAPAEQPQRYGGTILEDANTLQRKMQEASEEIENTIPTRRRDATREQPQEPSDLQTSQTLPDADGTQPFRPIHRPPMALIRVLDDGRETGETFRVRGESAIIGRVKGDIVIPHDGGISTQHAELVRRFHNGNYQWFIKDLNSTNGTFARANKAELRPNLEILLGSRRYRFETQQNPQAPAAIVELTSQGRGRVMPITTRESYFGSDPQQAHLGTPDDPYLNRRHARIFCDQQGRWFIENCESLNGTWVRIDEIPIRTTAEFQCGEQRFLVKVP